MAAYLSWLLREAAFTNGPSSAALSRVTSIVVLSEALFAVFFDFFVFSSRFNWLQTLGTALIVISMALEVKTGWKVELSGRRGRRWPYFGFVFAFLGSVLLCGQSLNYWRQASDETVHVLDSFY